MKILVAETDKSKSGFTFTNPQEMVSLGMACCNSRSCGCGRSFNGFDTRKGTTLARVTETNLTKQEYINLLRTSLEIAGFGRFMDNSDIEAEADDLLRIADYFPNRTLVRRNKTNITAVN